MKLSEHSRLFLEKNLPEALHADDPDLVLDQLYDLIVYKGFLPHWEQYNEFGREAQEVYDDVWDNNCAPR